LADFTHLTLKFVAIATFLERLEKGETGQ